MKEKSLPATYLQSQYTQYTHKKLKQTSRKDSHLKTGYGAKS